MKTLMVKRKVFLWTSINVLTSMGKRFIPLPQLLRIFGSAGVPVAGAVPKAAGRLHPATATGGPGPTKKTGRKSP